MERMIDCPVCHVVHTPPLCLEGSPTPQSIEALKFLDTVEGVARKVV